MKPESPPSCSQTPSPAAPSPAQRLQRGCQLTADDRASDAALPLTSGPGDVPPKGQHGAGRARGRRLGPRELPARPPASSSSGTCTHGGGREVKGRSTLTTVTSREGNKHESVQARPGTADERGASRGHRRSGPASRASPGAGARDPLAPRGPPAPGELPARPRRASSSSGRSRHLTLPWATRHPRCPVKAAACERRGDGAELRPRARTELPPTGDDPQPPGARGAEGLLSEV